MLLFEIPEEYFAAQGLGDGIFLFAVTVFEPKTSRGHRGLGATLFAFMGFAVVVGYEEEGEAEETEETDYTAEDDGGEEVGFVEPGGLRFLDCVGGALERGGAGGRGQGGGGTGTGC